jgi:hypothetical protein
MKTILSTLGAAFLLLSMASDAQAVVCARGMRGAGCAGPNGAVATTRPPVAAPPRAVVVPPPRAVVVPPPRAVVVPRR